MGCSCHERPDHDTGEQDKQRSRQSIAPSHVAFARKRPRSGDSPQHCRQDQKLRQKEGNHNDSQQGTKPKADLERIWQSHFRHMKVGLEMTVIGMAAEDDKVAAEIRSHAELTNGRVYENQNLMLRTIRRGRITETTEYADILLIADMFG
jgi:ketosteroid isomerase-like protein